MRKLAWNAEALPLTTEVAPSNVNNPDPVNYTNRAVTFLITANDFVVGNPVLIP